MRPCLHVLTLAAGLMTALSTPPAAANPYALPPFPDPTEPSDLDPAPLPETRPPPTAGPTDLSVRESVPVPEDTKPPPTALPPPAAAPAPTSGPIAGLSPAPTTTSSPWIPRGEDEAMADRPLGASGRVTFKPGAGILISTADERFSLKISGWAQLRLTVNHNQNPAPGAPNPSGTLEFNRARLILTGNMGSKHIHYMAHLMFAPKDLGWKDGAATRPPIFVWYTAYTRFKNANLQAGFFFVPHARQRMQPAGMWQFPDNSTSSYEFTLNQDIGVQLSSPDIAGLGLMRYYAGVFMGDGYDYAKASDFGLTYTGRFELLPLGMFQDYSEGDFERSRRPKLSLGIAYAFGDRDHQTRQIAGTTFADGGTMNAHNITADVVLKWAGVSFLGDFYLRRGWRNPGGLTDMTTGDLIPVQAVRNGYGWTAQAGVLLPRTRFEMVGRYAGVRPSRTLTTSLARLDEAGGGLNYYFLRHALKLQLDYIHTWGPALPLGRGDQVRLQLQLAF